MMPMGLVGASMSMLVLGINALCMLRDTVTLGLVIPMFTWRGIFFLRGLGAGRPGKGDTATAAGWGPSVVATAGAGGVVDEQALDARQLRKLNHGAAQIKVCRCTYRD